MPCSTARIFTWKCLSPRKLNKKMDLQSAITRYASVSASPPLVPDPQVNKNGGDFISLREWQGWGTSSPVPAMVLEIVEGLKVFERDSNAQMSFGGLGGKLQGNFKAQEDKKHRASYQALEDSEQKLQFFSARQIACRLLGSRGYLCQKCWLPLQDCMCSKLVPCSLWPGIRFWLYMHPKDFLRQNNTGKLLWQIFGVQAACLCLFGIREHEEIMWNAFERAAAAALGKSRVWCLYPNQNAAPKSVRDICFEMLLTGEESQIPPTNSERPLNFLLIDGTWSNSAAMFKRLKEQTKILWGEDDLPCISLSTPGVSVMHKLRPQPSWDRTCTAGAAIGLLSELHLLSGLGSLGLDKQAEAVEDGLDVLFNMLTARRLRMGRSVTRRQRNNVKFSTQGEQAIFTRDLSN